MKTIQQNYCHKRVRVDLKKGHSITPIETCHKEFGIIIILGGNL